MENRSLFTPAGLSLETREGDQNGVPDVIGLAAPFYDAGDPGTRYVLWEGAEERILPTAFDRSLEFRDVVSTYNHNTDVPLGRVSASTLSLTTDERGLWYRIKASATTAYRDLVESVRRGDVSGSSFTFRVDPTGEEWRDESGVKVRNLLDVELIELGPVMLPAYAATTAGVRGSGGIVEARESYQRWIDSLADTGQRQADRRCVDRSACRAAELRLP